MSLVATIERVASEELLEGLRHLLPQLSSSAAPLQSAMLTALLDDDDVTLFSVRDDDKLIGSLTLVTFTIPTGVRAWIEDVVVDEGARGRGVGQCLVEAAIAEARRRGARTVDLTSRPSREGANALYQKIGFTPRDTNVYRYSLEN